MTTRLHTGLSELSVFFIDIDLLELQREVVEALLVEDLLEGQGSGGVFGFDVLLRQVRFLEEGNK